MLTRRRWRRALAAMVAAAASLSSTIAGAQQDEKDDAVREPERITIGVADQFLGQLSPDERKAYFVSNRNTSNEIYVQDVEAGGALLLFDEGADATWPRVSPDGRQLLYISFRDDAGGQLCVRTLSGLRPAPPVVTAPARQALTRALASTSAMTPATTSASSAAAPRASRPAAAPRVSDRRCLADGKSALQAQWIDDHRIALVSRASAQSDLGLVEVDVAGGGALTPRPMLQRNVTSPAFSPDGRWMVYVPVERYVDRVGPGFASRAAGRLEAVRLDRRVVDGAAVPVPLVLDVPGMTGQPAFAADGHHLYFAQFLNDSNRDGVVDAGDNGVLFRVPWPGDRDDAPASAAASAPEQLTGALWNCQYPSPSRAMLVATCSQRGHLDVYSLPLDGMVPSSWSRERLETEIGLAARRREKLLLRRHLLPRLTDPTERRSEMLSLILLHLEFDELDAASYYVRHIRADVDPATKGISRALDAWIDLRRAVRARELGRIDVDFAEGTRKRLEELDPKWPGSPTSHALRRIVRSELYDAIGDPEGARRELESADLDGVRLLPVLQAYYNRADALYRALDDRDGLVAACVRLSRHPATGVAERYGYDRAAVRALMRGRPFDEADAALAARMAEERAAPAPDEELLAALEVGRAMLTVRDADPSRATRDALIALYQKQPRVDRKRAFMLDVVQRADVFAANRVIEDLAQLYVDDLPRSSSERIRAETLYRRVMLGRAYRRKAEGRVAEAQSDFHKVAEATGSLEAHMFDIELRLRAGATVAGLEEENGRRDLPDAIHRFIHAYLVAHELPDMAPAERSRRTDETIATLRGAWPQLKKKRGVQALYGSLLHGRFMEHGDLAAAQEANVRYLTSLELVGENPRYRAMILQQLGLLHTQVGNYRVALGYLQDREKLPFADDVRALAHHLTKARVLLHLERENEAAVEGDRAVAVLDRTPALAEYAVVALDRAALFQLAAGRFDRALALYDRALPLLTAPQGPVADRNRVVLHVARAAAALGAGQPRRAIEDLDEVDRVLGPPAASATTASVAPTLLAALAWPHTAPEEVLRSYRAIAGGLRARSQHAVGDLDATARALEARRDQLEARLLASKLDEHVRALALIEGQLGDLARERNDRVDAVRWARSALARSDDFGRRTGVRLDVGELDAIWLAAELRVWSGARLGMGINERLRAAEDRIVADADPRWRSYERLFEIYIALTDDSLDAK